MKTAASGPGFSGHCRGLGYAETLVCIAVSALLLSLAAPQLRNAIVQQRVGGVRAELMASLQWARWEALRRNTTVTLQRRADCDAALPDEDHWSCGWQLVAGEDVRRDTPIAETAVLQSFTVPQGLRLVHPGGGAQVQFARTGYPVLVAHKFVVGLPGRNPDAVEPRQASTLCINRTGRVRRVEGQTSC